MLLFFRKANSQGHLMTVPRKFCGVSCIFDQNKIKISGYEVGLPTSSPIWVRPW